MTCVAISQLKYSLIALQADASAAATIFHGDGKQQL